MATEFADAPDRQRYELRSDGELVGLIDYRLRDGVITLVHTEVLPAFSGQGHASTLARGALDDARARGLAVVPSCPYVAAYITKHPEYADLVRAG
ncbi:GNAT family N-acetyltransferase [Nocardioides hwasunensis]|uniref:N-acetyltransferase n=1 Tax=Nocardioides hwasunensis TaxID=397258 RepID=A0ABR8MKA1_9ACTN|nr:GNAT family N-acetyltransferase [Nocardioides hwasunensis]MBD3916353.1 N-acetyltransferase [Nocardioides hwasunensis]